MLSRNSHGLRRRGPPCAGPVARASSSNSALGRPLGFSVHCSGGGCPELEAAELDPADAELDPAGAATGGHALCVPAGTPLTVAGSELTVTGAEPELAPAAADAPSAVQGRGAAELQPNPRQAATKATDLESADSSIALQANPTNRFPQTVQRHVDRD